MIKIAATVVLYNPNINDLSNIDTYLDDVEKLYIVDNSEQPLNNEIIDNQKIEYIFNNGNLGIATALNIAAKKAINDGYSWLLTMDQDTKFQKDIIEQIKYYIERENMSDVGIVTPWHHTFLSITKPTAEIDYPLDVMTSGNFVNLAIYEKIGGFRDDFFIDGVDIEYCLKLKKNNFNIVRLNYLEIEHNLGDISYATFLGKKYMCTNHNYLRNYYMARNYRYIRQEYYDIARDFCTTLVKFKGIVFKIIMFENDKYRKIRNIFRGIKDYKKGIKGKYNYKD